MTTGLSRVLQSVRSWLGVEKPDAAQVERDVSRAARAMSEVEHRLELLRTRVEVMVKR